MKIRHIVIDAGYSQTYHRTLSVAIRQIVKKGERIDLFVLTHTDSDHLGGAVSFLKEFGTSLVDQFWMNYAPKEIVAADSGPVGVAHGITLRDLLIYDHKLNTDPVITGQVYQIGNISLSILSPDADQYERFLAKWEAQEQIIKQRKQPVAPSTNDYLLPINTLVNRPFLPDSSWSNRSSIGFLLSVGHFVGLFTGDAHADVIINALRLLGFTEVNPIRLTWFKVSHHGSKANTNNELLSLIDCQQYIISSNGANQYQLPHKETLARIVTAAHMRRPKESIHMYFTYNDRAVHSLFTQQEISQYNIRCHYPTIDENKICVTYHES